MQDIDILMMEMESAVRRVLPSFASAAERWRRYFEEGDLAQEARLALWAHARRNGTSISRRSAEIIARNAMISLIRRASKWALNETYLEGEEEDDEEEH